MSRLNVFHAPLLLSLALVACPAPKLTRRYRSVSFETVTAGNEHIEVAAFSTTVPAGKSKPPVTGLSDRGQAEVAKALATKAPKKQDFLEALSAPFGSRKRGVVSYETIYRRRIVFSVSKIMEMDDVDGKEVPRVSPADRIDELQVTLQPLAAPATFEFLTWNRFETQYQTVDLGKISRSHNRTLGFKIGAGPLEKVATPISPEVSGSFERKLSEEVVLRQRYVALSGRLAADEAVLYQQGTVGIDLAGTFLVDVTIKVPPKPGGERLLKFGNLFRANVAQPSNQVTVSQRFVVVPLTPQDISCALSARYRLRRVGRAGRTVIEGDDTVRMLQGALTNNDFLLLRAEDLKRRAWKIVLSGPAAVTVGGVGALYVSKFEDATSLLAWLEAAYRGQPAGTLVSIGGRAVADGGVAVTAAKIPRLGIEVFDLN